MPRGIKKVVSEDVLPEIAAALKAMEDIKTRQRQQLKLLRMMLAMDVRDVMWAWDEFHVAKRQATAVSNGAVATTAFVPEKAGE